MILKINSYIYICTYNTVSNVLLLILLIHSLIGAKMFYRFYASCYFFNLLAIEKKSNKNIPKIPCK